MLKKIFGAMLMITLAASISLVCTPAKATSDLAKSGSVVEQSAPDSYFVEGIVDVSINPYIFYSEGKYGHVYRGWLSAYKEIHPGVSAYRGYLYREPLSYPTPFVSPIDTE
ncbi:hypothetical protein [Bacillus chungangensis]|uniref:Uncharacterized protein n=1 Tax=Bacillus chungangensis TaxID=587633 RepID=A0ABT9WV16_9BACI|nr:hypothetical protein [Bacillus chungangensis]MDQ0177144.1 hypothetical protein [Bacillus chungangensis]